MSACEHPVGYLQDVLVTASDWNTHLAAYVSQVELSSKIANSNLMPHGNFQEFQFCPECGIYLDRVALGLMNYAETYEINETSILAGR